VTRCLVRCAARQDFWDIKRNALLGSMRAKDTITCDWSPDSKYFLTSTLAPRLKVDNGFKVWNYYGKLVHQTNMDELYQVRGVHAAWRTAQVDQSSWRLAHWVWRCVGAPGHVATGCRQVL